MVESSSHARLYACSAPVYDGLLCAFGQWYLAAGHDEAPLYASVAGMIGFGVTFFGDFHRIMDSLYARPISPSRT